MLGNLLFVGEELRKVGALTALSARLRNCSDQFRPSWGKPGRCEEGELDAILWCEDVLA
jgi:hypothetical protein